MKAKVSLKSVRESFKSVNNGSMFAVIKQMYALFTNEQGKVSLPAELAKIMPASKKQALSEAQAILDWGKVGEQREIKRKNTVIYSTIKASSDMVLRYYVAKYNEAVPEDAQK